MGTSPSTSACDGACCGAFAASSSSLDAACNNVSAHPVLLHGCDTTAELHIRSTSHYVVRSCTTAELHIRSTSHYIVCSCACRKLLIFSASYHRNLCLEPSVRGARLEVQFCVRLVWSWTWIELSTSCVGVQIFAYHRATRSKEATHLMFVCATG